MKKEIRVEDFTLDTLDTQLAGVDSKTSIKIYSPSDLKLLEEIGPNYISEVNDSLNLDLRVNNGAILDQTKTLLAQMLCTIDNTLFNGHTNTGSTASKIKTLESICKSHSLPLPFTTKDLTQSNAFEYAIKSKLFGLNFLKLINDNLQNKVIMSQEDEPLYVQDLKEILGNNLESVIQYGSSVTDPNGKDIDLMLFLNQIDPETYTLIENKASQMRSEKPVGIVLLPSALLPNYASCDDNINLIAQNGKLIHGNELSVPIVPREEIIQRSYIKIASHIDRLRGSMGNLDLLSKMSEVPGLFDFFVKQELWIGKGLRQFEDQRLYSKSEFLRLEHIEVPSFESGLTMSKVSSILRESNCRVNKRIDYHLKKISH